MPGFCFQVRAWISRLAVTYLGLKHLSPVIYTLLTIPPLIRQLQWHGNLPQYCTQLPTVCISILLTPKGTHFLFLALLQLIIFIHFVSKYLPKRTIPTLNLLLHPINNLLEQPLLILLCRFLPTKPGKLPQNPPLLLR